MFKHTYQVALYRPLEPHDPESYASETIFVEVEARSHHKAKLKALLSTPGIWHVVWSKRV